MEPAGARILEKFRNVVSFHIPSLICELCPLRINPAFNDAFVEEIDEWCFQFLGLKPTDKDKRKRVADLKLGFFAAACSPALPPENLVLAGKFFAFFFMADDALDSTDVCPSDVKNVTAAYIRIFKDNCYEAAKSMIQTEEILRQMDMFHKIWEDLKALVDKQARDRLAEALESSFQAFQLESAWIHDKIVPNLETYEWMRRPVSVTLPCLVLNHCLQPIGLSLEEAAQDPHMKKLETIVIDYIYLFNDIVSFRQEWANGKYLNIIPLLAFYNGCSINDAIVKAIEMVKELELDYMHVTSAISSNVNPDNKDGAKEFVEAMGAWIRGTAAWSLTSCRYHDHDRHIDIHECFGTFTLFHKDMDSKLHT